MIEYENLSLHISKEQLRSIVNDMSLQDYFIFWGFDRGKMILNVYHADSSNELTFIRHRHSMELTYAKIRDADVMEILERSIQFKQRAEENYKQAAIRQKKKKYQEIDYYLSELHEYMNQGNEQKIKETKALLKQLLSDAS